MTHATKRTAQPTSTPPHYRERLAQALRLLRRLARAPRVCEHLLVPDVTLGAFSAFSLLRRQDARTNVVSPSVSCARTGEDLPSRPLRYELHLIEGTGERIVQVEMDIQLKRGDVIPHGTESYTVGSVQGGYEEFDGIVFAVHAKRAGSSA